MATATNGLSAQDLQDLKEITTHLPAGHPMQKKISLVLNAPDQKTQFEQEHSPQAGAGFIPHLIESGKSMISSAPSVSSALLGPAADVAKGIYGAGREMGAARERGHGLPYSAAAGLSTLAGVSPERMESAAEQGDTSGVVGEAALPTALAAGGYLAPKVRSGLRDISFDPNTAKMNPGARAVSKVAGGVAGSAFGHLVGHPIESGIGGMMMGPTIMEKILGKPEAMPKAPKVAPNPFPDATATDPAHAQFLKNFGPEYKEAGDLAEWETGNREGGPVTGGWNTTSKFGSPSLVNKFEAPKPEVEGVEGSIAKPSGRLVLLPEEEAARQQMQNIATKRASEHGMLYAAGMRPSGTGKVPGLPTGTKTPFAPPSPEPIEFDEFGRPKEKP